MNVSVIGLGKLGAPLAAVLADKGHTVMGVDVDPARVEALAHGKAPVEETGLQELIAKNGRRLSATLDGAAAVQATEATFIVVPTPSDAHGTFSNACIAAAAEPIGQALRRKNSYHLIVLTSTVMPGTTGGLFLPLLEEHSGRRAGVDFGVCYNPEFIALGSVIADLLHPDLILIGESDPRAGSLLAGLYEGVGAGRPPICRMNFVNAELAKLALNTFVTTKISYANMLAEICEKLEGADVDVVTRAIGTDARVGRKYLTGAVSFGGPCFPRDNQALAAMAGRLGVGAALATATDQINRRQVTRIVEMAVSKLEPRGGGGGTVAILGLAYKAGTEVSEGSMGVEVARALAAQGVRVVVYDPLAAQTAKQQLPENVVFASSMRDATQQADVIVLPLLAEEFRRLSPQDLKTGARRPTLIDCWRMLDADRFRPHAEYVAVGIFHAPS